MKKLSVIVLGVSLLFYGFTISLENQNISPLEPSIKGDNEMGIKFFKGSWADALKKAEKSDKLIFLDAYASWCGPCKLMAKKTFPDEEVGAFFNKHFINVKMDMEKNPDGPRLSKKFKLSAYPTLYFVDKNEELVHQQLGYLKPKQLISVGEIALDK